LLGVKDFLFFFLAALTGALAFVDLDKALALEVIQEINDVRVHVLVRLRQLQRGFFLWGRNRCLWLC